jgi:hypothetical protein
MANSYTDEWMDKEFPTLPLWISNVMKRNGELDHIDNVSIQPVKGSRGTIAALSKPTSEGGWIDQ